MAPKQTQYNYTFNMIFPDTNEEYLLSVENGVLNYTADKLAVRPNTTLIIDRSELDSVLLGEKKLKDAVYSYGGNLRDFVDFLNLLDTFNYWFNIVLP